MKKKLKLISAILINACLLSLMSCGKDSGSTKNTTLVTQEEQEQDDQGIYRAVLLPINSDVAGTTTGTVEIRIEGDDFSVESSIAGSPAGVKHFQNIMMSTACPDMSVDKNSDGLIDFKETLSLTGPILIPLDSDLNTQLDGMSYGPIANSAGIYVYRRSTTLSQILSDLGALDPDPTDLVTKLPLGQNLNLSGRVILIHGVRSSEKLPDSVATVGEASRELMLPIACGKLVRVNSEG